MKPLHLKHTLPYVVGQTPHYGQNGSGGGCCTCKDKAVQLSAPSVDNHTSMSGHNRSRPRRQVTLSPEVDAYLGQQHINASGLVDAAVREIVTDTALEQAGVGEYSDENDDAAED